MYIKKKNNNSFFSTICFLSIVYALGSSIVGYHMGKKDIESDTYIPSLLSSNINQDVINKLEEELSMDVDSDHEDELYILNSIYENSNLTKDEKNVFYGYYSIICDLQNMDRNSAYNSLSRVSVNNVDRGEGVSENTLGDYDFKTNKINIYTKNDIDNSVLLHEGIHCLFYNQKTIGLPRAFTEGMTELITNEYFSTYPFYENNTYPFEVCYLKMLCELLGTDLIVDTFLSGDYSLIYREMDKYNNSDYSSYKVLDIYEDSYNNIGTLSSSKYTNQERWKAYKIVEDIYNKKNNSKNNIKEFNYYHELSASSFEENAVEFYSDYVFYYGVLEKAYISTDLKEQLKNNDSVKLFEGYRLNR